MGFGNAKYCVITYVYEMVLFFGQGQCHIHLNDYELLLEIVTLHLEMGKYQYNASTNNSI